MDPRPALARHFGYADFRPGQEPLVRAALEGRDALGILPTGGGKSVCYMLPAALLPGLTIVVSPLISLMDDQVVRANRAGIPAALVNSTQSTAERDAVLARARSGALRLLLVAPERFQVPAFQRAIEGVDLSLLAVDESHCIAQWGHDFRPAYRTLGDVRDRVGAPVMALTATATPRVREEIRRSLRLRSPEVVVGSFDRPNLSWHVHRVRTAREREAGLVSEIRRALAAGEGAAVAYAGTRRTVERIRNRIAGLGLPAEAYHGGLDGDERSRVQEAFMDGRARVVVATNAFGMGVDKPDVRLVVHWQLPGTLEAYYQEAGRAGRDGAPARCVAFHGQGDDGLHRSFIDRARPPARSLRRTYVVLRRLQRDARVRETVRHLAGCTRGVTGSAACVGALGALEGAGAVRLLSPLPEEGSAAAGAPGAGDPGLSVGSQYVHLELLPGPLDLSRPRTLRRSALDQLRAVTRYATARKCRRRVLLGYFGEDAGGRRCDRCDRCGAAT
jgi:ATP-dependent DNA helicase RecQ